MKSYIVWRPLIYALARRIGIAAVSGALSALATELPKIQSDTIAVDPNTAIWWAIFWIVIEAVQKGYRLWRDA